jgi:predicted nucleic acid-binding protein
VSASCLIDTNVLLRFVKPDDSDYGLVRSVVVRLSVTKVDLCYTSQILGEFWNACTRPADRNGYGLSILETDRRARLIEAQFRLLVDSPAVDAEWRTLLVTHSVSGAQVHDARLAASMGVHRVRSILSFNASYFSRFSGLHIVDPRLVASHG